MHGKYNIKIYKRVSADDYNISTSKQCLPSTFGHIIIHFSLQSGDIFKFIFKFPPEGTHHARMFLFTTTSILEAYLLRKGSLHYTCHLKVII